MSETASSELLFVYGTLRPGRAPAEIAAIVNLIMPVGEATVRARLHDLGAYPGIVLDANADNVPGVLLALPADPDILAQLDAYEGFIPAHPEISLFRRVKTTATRTNGEPAECWVYIYNRPLP
jgi:gamma-glutamylcyclotransferase (GGCT)/AIG2-like uncharacterized protein YtfP